MCMYTKRSATASFFVPKDKMHIKNDKNENKIHYERKNEYER